MSEPAEIVDGTPAASSPAAPANTSDRVAPTGAARQEWLRTGTIPDATADSSPAEPAAQAAPTGATDKAPASEPGKKKKGVQARNEELEAEIAALHENLARRAALRARNDELDAEEAARGGKGDSKKADAPAADRDPEPVEANYENWNDYLRDKARWEARQVFREEQDRLRAEADAQKRAEQFEKRVETARSKVQKAAEADPEFVQKVHPGLLNIAPVSALPPNVPIRPEHVIAQEILDSEHTADLLLHFSAHPEDFARIAQLPPSHLLREFGRLEARFEKGADATSAVPSIPVSRAPAPPRTVGKAPAEPADELAVALKKGDFASYRAGLNRQRVAQSRGQ